MSELTKTFVYTRLSDFLSSGFQLPRTVQIIPYAYIRSTDEVVAILTMNNLGVLTDFGTNYSSRTDLVSYIERDLDENSFGLLKRDREYIMEHGSIAYTKMFDVSTGVEALYNVISPVVFVRMEFERSEDLEEILNEFSVLFAKKIEGLFNSTSSTYNIVFISISDLFYTCRGTVATRRDETTGHKYEFDVSLNGFPADARITKIYKAVASSGDIPFDYQVNQYANCCPEVNFYSDVSSTMKFSLMNFFLEDLPILEKHERYSSVVVREHDD